MASISVKKSIIGIVAVAFFAAIAVYLEIAVPFHINFKEQTSIFIPGQGFLWQYFSRPAALSKFIADFLTQFFAYRHLATAIIVLVLIALLFAVQKTLQSFSRDNRNNVLTWSVAFAITGLECALFTQICWDFTTVIGLLLACIIFLIWNKLNRTWLQYILIAISFPLIGGHTISVAIMTAAFLAIKERRYISMVAVLLEAFIAIVLVSKLEMFHIWDAIIYPQYSSSLSSNSYLFLLSVLIWIISAVLISYCPAHTTVSYISIGVSFSICLVSFILTNDKQTEFRMELLTYTYHGDWEKAKQRTLEENQTDKFSIFIRNYAFARKGTLPENLLKYPQFIDNGIILGFSEEDDYMTLFMNLDTSLELGNIAWAIDLSLVGLSKIPWHTSSRILRRCAEISIVTGDYDVAMKYLKMLSRSCIHKEWALTMMDNVINNAIAKRLVELRALTPATNTYFNNVYDIDAMLAVANGNPYNKGAIDCILCTMLLLNDLEDFVNAYDHFYYNKFDSLIKVADVYQEALVYTAKDSTQLEEIVRKYRIDKEIVEKYLQFVQAKNSGNSELLPQNFESTYWGYVSVYKSN